MFDYLGPICGRCGRNEAACAKAYPCCKNCAHKFGTEPEPVVLPPEPKPVYERRKDKHTQSRELVTLPEPFDGIWFVAPSGLAHIWTSAAVKITHCGLVRGNPPGGPVEEWYDYCRACAKHDAKARHRALICQILRKAAAGG